MYSFDSSIAEGQMKTLMTSWHSFTGFALRSSSVDMDTKVAILNMCFCLIRIGKISAAEIETTLRQLCEEVKTGIKNMIMSSSSSRRTDVLGLGVRFKEELLVSCTCRFVLCMFLNQWNSTHISSSLCRSGIPCFQRTCLWLQQCVRVHGKRSAARQ